MAEGGRWRAVLRFGRGVFGSALTVCVLGAIGVVAWLESGPRRVPVREVRDVTELIRIDVERVASPRNVDELRALIARHEGPISIGGGRFSMGGQIGVDDALFLDLREMDDVLHLDADARTVRVEAGITWRKLIEAIDPHGLSVKIMQSYANFTVGGSLSVNAHGRYVGEGPIVHSVRAIELVLADGSLVRADREQNAELFWAAAGGYGAVGAIAVVELDLARNQPLERTVERMPVDAFAGWFDTTIRDAEQAVMFNADLYPPAYDDLVAITFSETERAVTVPDRLQPGGGSSRVDRLMYWYVAEGPLGKQAREQVIDKLRLASKPVVYRNHEATYDVASLDPGSRAKRTYILQEYFIPVERFTEFVPKMREVFQRHDVNVMNVSIRHASAEPDSLLTWAPVEVFAFVVYHEMKTTPEAWQHAETWTREMLDAVLASGGRYYLPYQIHATPEQFHASYPRAAELFALRREVDPDHTFRNHLWDTYDPPPPSDRDVDAIRATLAARPTWARPEDQTFLTLPEWLIVYSADETGAFLRDHRPSEFPWFAAIGQFWTNYRAVWGRTRDEYPFNTGYHVMIGVIGASYTVEYGVKGAWESTVGRLTEGSARVPEEDLYAEITADYGAFTHHTPWYAFPFAERRARLGEVDGAGLRGTERQLVTWVELTAKSWWAWCIEAATGTAYDPEAATLEVWVQADEARVAGIPGVSVLERLGPHDLLLSVPRYEPFTAAAIELAARDVEVVEIAGGERILVQLQTPARWDEAELWGDVLVDWTLLSDPTRKRWAVEVAVRRLDEVLPALQAAGATIEHLYDF